MHFTNRTKELTRLDRLVKNKESSFGVIWGRRRIGKTRLLLEWLLNKKGIYYTADESAAAVQRKYFSIALETYLPGFAAVDYPDWNSLLTRLAKDAQRINWRGPIVIDEFPYLILSSPEFPSVFQKFIDHEAKLSKLTVIVSGSSQHMMQGAILDASAPLYGRAQELIKLEPMMPSYLKEALKLSNAREAIEYYSIWGGMPRYWELASHIEGSLFNKVEQLALDPMGPLHDEPQYLLREEIPSASSLRPILDVIGLGASKLTEIATRLGQPVTSLSRPLQRLRALGLIEREVPFGVLEHTSKKTLYKIHDPFIRFWFEVLAPRRSLFAQATTEQRKKWFDDALPRLCSIVWEELCRQAIPFLDWNLGSDITFSKAGRLWKDKECEWDIVATSLDAKKLLIGEAKWLTSTMNSKKQVELINALINKGKPSLSTSDSSSISYALFVPQKSNMLNREKNVFVFDAEDILQKMR